MSDLHQTNCCRKRPIDFGKPIETYVCRNNKCSNPMEWCESCNTSHQGKEFYGMKNICCYCQTPMDFNGLIR